MPMCSFGSSLVPFSSRHIHYQDTVLPEHAGKIPGTWAVSGGPRGGLVWWGGGGPVRRAELWGLD